MPGNGGLAGFAGFGLLRKLRFQSPRTVNETEGNRNTQEYQGGDGELGSEVMKNCGKKRRESGFDRQSIGL